MKVAVGPLQAVSLLVAMEMRHLLAHAFYRAGR